MSSRLLAALVAFLVLLVVLSQSLFVVRSTDHAALLRFGQVAEPDLLPGLHIMIPLVDDVRRYDARSQVSDIETPPLLTADNNSLVLDTYVLWRVADARRFVEATGGSSHEAEAHLLPLVREALRNSLQGHSLHDIVAMGQEPDPGNLLPGLAAKGAELGIQVEDLRILSISYADAAAKSVFQRMNTVFKTRADGIRAAAQAAADQSEATAEAGRRQVAADAKRQAEQIRGDGDSQAAAITTAAAGSDPEFYRFYRAMEIYRQGFARPRDVLILRDDDELLKYLKSPGK